MKRLIPLLLIVLLCGLAFVSWKGTSAVRGKAVDGKGKPMAGISVVARQISPAGRRMRTTTNDKGKFQFKRVTPATYEVVPVIDKSMTSAKVIVEAGPKPGRYRLPSPLVVRITKSPAAFISDSHSGLQWFLASEATMTWTEAAGRAAALPGGGWRLPTRAELGGIYDESYEGHADPLFLIDRNWVWTSEIAEDEQAWFFSFENEYEGTHPKEWLLTRGRVLAVRNRPDR